MMRWISQMWLSATADRGRPPSALWRWTFGRFKSHRDFSSRLRDLDAQLSRQAASQQRAIARQPQPVGRYRPRNEDHPAAAPWWSGLLRPALVVGACAVAAVAVWTLWPNYPEPEPQRLVVAFEDSFDRLRQPLSQQVERAGELMQQQTDHIRQLPQRMPQIDRVVNDLGQAIEAPIREEVRRFTRDMTEPWVYLMNQLPLPVSEATEPEQGSGV